MSTRNFFDQARDKAAAPAPIFLPGIVVGHNYPTFASVDVGGSVIDVACIGGQFPAVGDPVTILRLGEQLVCLGATPKPAHGVVAASASGGRVSVTADDSVTYSLNYNHLYTPSIGDHVKIDWDLIGGFVVGPMAAAPTGDPDAFIPSLPDTGGGSGPVAHSHVFYPTASGTWNGSRYYKTAVDCGDTANGVYVYGNQIDNTIPDGATITSIRLYLAVQANYVPGVDANFGYTALASLSGPTSATSPQAVSEGTGWKPLSLAIGNAFKTGAAHGIAAATGGYHIFEPKGGNSGALSISWKD